MKTLLKLLLFFGIVSLVAAESYQLSFAPETPVQEYAIGRLTQALAAADYTPTGAEPDCLISVEFDGGLAAEGYGLEVSADAMTLSVADDRGLLYGVLDVAESLAHGVPLSQLAGKSSAPANGFRAIKFNLPWRSYRFGPALAQHMETARDLVFWERFLDMMAENRFNALTLWNLHPFSYMIRAENFPFACDLKTDAELADWQSFYRQLFQMAADRGIDTYVVNWNIFVPDGFVEHYDLPRDRNVHRWNESVSPEMDALIRQYTRESVSQTLNEYPNLTGIGLSLGEAMNGMNEHQRQEWVLDTIVRGVQEADRPARLIHRVPFSGGDRNFGDMDKGTEILTRQALEGITGVEGPILVEVKFNWSHAHSTPDLVKVHGGFISDTYWNPPPDDYELIWMARNEDFFFLRWGQADFIREHIRRNRHPYVGGYFVGSEMYIPALDYFTRPERQVDWDYAFERQWLFYQMWGRLLYDPTTPDEVFVRSFARRYGDDYAQLFDAYAVVSQVPLLICSNWDVTNDRSIYAEMFMSNRRQPERRATLISVQNLIADRPLDPRFVSIRDYVAASISRRPFDTGRVIPPALADEFESLGHRALRLILGLDPANDSLAYEIGDVRAWSRLALYMADKIRGATAFHFFEETGEAVYQQQAVAHLTAAREHWIELVAVTTDLYPEAYCQILPNGLEETWHWSRLLPAVQADIDFVAGP